MRGRSDRVASPKFEPSKLGREKRHGKAVTELQVLALLLNVRPIREPDAD